ncbi:Mov34/MPN/PAD-1 family protein [Psychrobacter immobilis]|mgnify:CR=1 FL=1|uniref:Mov34/MPN/PAD-1 family protein n=1 Tax=Psychrobacter TaxID=497 RepID=UPI001D1031AD|nr:Mov34/MPN/PAD-1 family protein [Psychrobacter immobilis]
MTITKHYKNLKLVVEDSLLKSIYQSSCGHYPKEYGGFLIGKYSDDFKTLYIEQSITAEVFKSSRIEFTRESNYLKSEFKKLFIDKRLYYIGEWHTHPDGEAWYSSTDLSAMINIKKDQGVSISNPILLILSITNDSLKDFNFFVLNNNRLELYE